LISITISVLMKILALCLIITFEAAVAKMLDTKSISLVQAGVSLFCLQGLGLCYALLIEDHSLQVIVVDVSTIIFYILLVLKLQFQWAISFWIVFLPIHLLIGTVFVWLVYRRTWSRSRWNVLRSSSWLGLLVGSIFLEIFVILLCQNLPHAHAPEVMLAPILLLTPLLLGLFFWMLPVCLYAGQFIEPLSLAVDYFEMSQGDREELIYRQPLLGHSLNGDDPDESEETTLLV
jgi:hypothetical protein